MRSPALRQFWQLRYDRQKKRLLEQRQGRQGDGAAAALARTPVQTLWGAGDSDGPLTFDAILGGINKYHPGVLPGANPGRAQAGATVAGNHVRKLETSRMVVADPIGDGDVVEPPPGLRKTCSQGHPGFCVYEHAHMKADVMHIARNLVAFFSGTQRRDVLGNLYRLYVTTPDENFELIVILSDIRYANPALQMYVRAKRLEGGPPYRYQPVEAAPEVFEHCFTHELAVDCAEVIQGFPDCTIQICQMEMELDYEARSWDFFYAREIEDVEAVNIFPQRLKTQPRKRRARTPGHEPEDMIQRALAGLRGVKDWNKLIDGFKNKLRKARTSMSARSTTAAGSAAGDGDGHGDNSEASSDFGGSDSDDWPGVDEADVDGGADAGANDEDGVPGAGSDDPGGDDDSDVTPGASRHGGDTDLDDDGGGPSGAAAGGGGLGGAEGAGGAAHPGGDDGGHGPGGGEDAGVDEGGAGGAHFGGDVHPGDDGGLAGDAGGAPPVIDPFENVETTSYVPARCKLYFKRQVGKAHTWLAELPKGKIFEGRKSRSFSVASPNFPLTGRSMEDAERAGSEWLARAEAAGAT